MDHALLDTTIGLVVRHRVLRDRLVQQRNQRCHSGRFYKKSEVEYHREAVVALMAFLRTETRRCSPGSLPRPS